MKKMMFAAVVAAVSCALADGEDPYADYVKMTADENNSFISFSTKGRWNDNLAPHEDANYYVAAADADGVVDLTKATVIDEVLSEVLNPDVDGTIIDLKDTDNPVLRTVTRKGLFYQLYEGRGLDTMTGGDSTIGNGELWTPEISVKGGNSAFYRIGVAPHEE